jgi:hypothetical protein
MRSAASNTQQAVDNFVLAACATVNSNLTEMFRTTWRFPISSSALQEAQSRWGGPVLLHPADIAPLDSAIQLDEATAYGAAWKGSTTWPIGPNPVPMGYAVRAATLYLSTALGDYTFSGSLANAPLCWNSPGSPVSQVSLKQSDEQLKLFGPHPYDLSVSSATRGMTNLYTASSSFVVTLQITPGTDVLAYGVEESVPIGWAVTNLTDGGVFDSTGGVIKWGVFLGAATRTLTYEVTPPSDATNVVTFTGRASFDGASVLMTGVGHVFPA